MNEHDPDSATYVVCADNEVLGTVEGDEQTHLRVRRNDGDPPIVWIDKQLIAGTSGNLVHLAVMRDGLHDGIIALTPNRQREYSTVAGMSLLRRWQAR